MSNSTFFIWYSRHLDVSRVLGLDLGIDVGYNQADAEPGNRDNSGCRGRLLHEFDAENDLLYSVQQH